jgi:hypothetical protein
VIAFATCLSFFNGKLKLILVLNVAHAPIWQNSISALSAGGENPFTGV